MQLTVTIPDEMAAQILARGLTPELYVEQLVSEHANVDLDVRETAARVAGLEQLFRVIANSSGNVPVLGQDSFTREALYTDHD